MSAFGRGYGHGLTAEDLRLVLRVLLASVARARAAQVAALVAPVTAAQEEP